MLTFFSLFFSPTYAGQAHNALNNVYNELELILIVSPCILVVGCISIDCFLFWDTMCELYSPTLRFMVNGHEIAAGKGIW